MDRLISRRELLGAGAAMLLVAACRDGVADTAGDGDKADNAAGASTTRDVPTPTTTRPGSTARPNDLPALTAAAFTALPVCKLLREQMAGPFPLEEQFDRRDIRENAAGQPMRLGFRVVDDTCTAVPGATVEVWHCDASGDYSAFVDGGGGKDEGAGTTFLRGSQTANADGIVEFLTIVPGWYTGRAVHIHVRAHVERAVVLTTQVYFDADYLAAVYASQPYAAFGPPDTSIAQDGIAGDAETDGSVLSTTAAPTSAGSGTLALLNLGIDRDAD